MSLNAASFERMSRDALYGLTFRPAAIKAVNGRNGPWLAALLLTIASTVPGFRGSAEGIGWVGLLVISGLFSAIFVVCLLRWSRMDNEGLQRSYATVSMAAWIMFLNAALLTLNTDALRHIDIVTSAWFCCAWAYYMAYRIRSTG